MTDVKFSMSDEGVLSIDVFYLIHELPDNRHIELVESLSCSNAVITHVMDQVLDGCTENGFSGSWSTNYTEPLQEYRMRIAKQSNDVAKKQIEELERRLKDMEELKDEYCEKYFKLYHKDRPL